MTFPSINGCFADQVRRVPSAVAVSAGDVRLTYRELDERSDRLAGRLAGLGAGPEVPVAMLVQRSVDMVVSVLAILKTGAYYVPLHDAYPLERMQWIMAMTKEPVLLADQAMRARGLPTARDVLIVDVDTDLPAPPSTDWATETHADQAAYLMFTSGTTGNPKGVVVTHRGVLGLLADSCWDSAWHDRLLMLAPHAFSVSTYEMWIPLLRGGTVLLAPPGGVDVAGLRHLITTEKITGLHLTAGLFRVLADEAPELFRDVPEVLTGGDVVSPIAVQRVLDACPNTVVRAMYGATEVSLFAANHPMSAPYSPESGVPIGRTMNGITAYVLDDRLSCVGDGVPAELYLAGDRLARGYYGRTDLTAERFVADPFGMPGSRMYRTGDVVRRTADGSLDFVGRAGDLVKIRGFRVELGEIESVVSKFPGVSDVAVVAHDDDFAETGLAAYVVPADVDLSALRAHTERLLPDYMVPTFLALDSLPLTPNGKLDRGALPVPEVASGASYRMPANARQELLCSLFAEVLGVPRVGIDDSFFDLDGQSLMAMRLISRIQSEVGVELTIADVFNAPTPASMDELLDTGTDTQWSA